MSSSRLLAVVRTDYARTKEDLALSTTSSNANVVTSRFDFSSKLPRHIHEQAVQNALRRLNISKLSSLDDSLAPSIVFASQDLLNQIVVDVKLSGLRRSREAHLLDHLHRLKVAISDVEAAQLKLLRSGRQAVGDVAMAACQVLECSDRKHQGALEALATRDAIIAEGRLAHKDMEQRLRDKEAAHKAWAEKLEAEADSRIDALIANSQQEIDKLQNVLEESHKASLKGKKHLQGELQAARSSIRGLEEQSRIREQENVAQMALQENNIEELRSNLKSVEEVVRERDREIDLLRGEVKDLHTRLQDETDQLNAAEEKVRHILEQKDSKISALLQRAEDAEEELRSLARV